MNSAYTQDLIHQRDRAAAEVRSAENELSAHRRERGDLIERTRAAEARAGVLANTLDAVLRTFVHKVHPGYAGLQSMMIPVDEVDEWRRTLANARAGSPDAIECDHETRAEQAETRIAAVRAECERLVAEVYGSHDEDDDATREVCARISLILDGGQPCTCLPLNSCDCGMPINTETVRGGRRLRRVPEARP